MDKIIAAILIKEVVAPLLILIAVVAIYKIISGIIKKVFSKNKLDTRKTKTLSSIINSILKYFLAAIAIISILDIYGISTAGIVASLGVVGLVAGLALQDVLKDFLSGISIVFENQYAVGDTISIGDFKGEVIYLGLKTTKIKAYTGEIKIIANRNITEVINHSLSNSLAVVNVGVSYDEDLDKVEKVLNKLCERLTEELPDIKDKVTMLGITELGSSAINYRIIVKTKSMSHFEIERKMMKEIKMEFDKNNILIPYNQMVIHNG